MNSRRSGTGIITMATKGGVTHTRNRTISGGVLTIRTKGWKAITQGMGCDIESMSRCMTLDKVLHVVKVVIQGRWHGKQ
jgi:hypothetical protein